MTTSSTPLASLAERVRALSDELADLALDRLMAASSDPRQRETLVAEERRLTKASRALAKAARELEPTDDGATGA
ncbi:MAG: hypothetical protein ACRDVP_10135 [Acidimicrobiales bacterium]